LFRAQRWTPKPRPTCAAPARAAAASAVCGGGVCVCAAHVDKARDLLGTELAALVSESYERAYQDMVRVQQLTELEEVIDYSQARTGRIAETRRMAVGLRNTSSSSYMAFGNRTSGSCKAWDPCFPVRCSEGRARCAGMGLGASQLGSLSLRQDRRAHRAGRNRPPLRNRGRFLWFLQPALR
jgi:FAT domain